MVGSGDHPNDDVALGPIETLVGYHIRRANGVIGTDFARAVAGTGLRQVLFGILSIVGANGAINQAVVGRLLGIQRANMAVLVTELVDNDWIERDTDAEDRRAFVLRLTDKGQALMADATRRLHAHEAALLADLSVAEQGQLIALLRRVAGQEA